uniref:Uncharacterized protein n=1 Tax=viral metagenome TaxID=1070528 RepID=A0A6M3JP64_9ZZZZ
MIKEKLETYQELKARQQKELNEFEGVFFAFDNTQFAEGMKKVDATDAKAEIYSLGAGGYIRKDRSKKFHEMLKRQDEEKKHRKKEEKFLFDSLVYELQNHEFCITYTVTDALDALGYDIKDIPTELLKKACKRALILD